MTLINVLDHGYVRLVDHMGNDLSIVRAARTSYDAAWRTGEDEGKDKKLIHYLWKNKHTTPFEAVTFTFEVKAPIFVFRQWHRHRTMSYNEVSARYTELAEEFYIPQGDTIGKQDNKNKQTRQIELGQLHLRNQELEVYRTFCELAFKQYKYLLINKEWPRELARMVLPLSTYSKMFVTVNLLNLLKFITLRDDDHAQYEIRVYAQALKNLITSIVPITMEAYDDQR